MTEDELKAIEARAKDASRFTMEARGAGDCLAVVAEVRRLRGLVKQAEWDGPTLGRKSYSCPWCEASFAPAEDMAKHIDCPAFTPEGEVR